MTYQHLKKSVCSSKNEAKNLQITCIYETRVADLLFTRIYDQKIA